MPVPVSFLHRLSVGKHNAATARLLGKTILDRPNNIYQLSEIIRHNFKHDACLKQMGATCFWEVSGQLSSRLFTSQNGWYEVRRRKHQLHAGIRMIGSRSGQEEYHYRRTVIIYVCAAGIFMLGMSYAGVPLYRMFCQATGLGGTVQRGHETSKVSEMHKVEDRVIRVRFNADVASSMRWNFKPQQTEVKVFPGETALAFYTAKNPTDKPIIGISTYNVVPFEAGQYFNKIQCFCFEEQRLNPHEQVDMPVFFYIDPEYAEDPKLKNVDTITLSYTFFEAKEGLALPLPGYMTQ